jgi:WD40 repeat protein
MSAPPKAVPLVAPGHTRPVTHLSFSPLLEDGTYLLISSCKDGNPMLRDWTGDWIGTFVGHKGAVWSTKLSRDGSRAVSGSADFTACVFFIVFVCVSRGRCSCTDGLALRLIVRSGIRIADIRFTRSRTTTSSEVSRSPHQPQICLPGDKKKRSEYSTSENQMRSQISYPTAMGSRTTAQSRALYGLTRIAP